MSRIRIIKRLMREAKIYLSRLLKILQGVIFGIPHATVGELLNNLELQERLKVRIIRRSTRSKYTVCINEIAYFDLGVEDVVYLHPVDNTTRLIRQ